MTKRVLVVCFSRDGSTSDVAKYLVKSLGAELDVIQESGTREGAGGYIRSAMEALAKGLPAIRTERNPRDYDLVVVGTPVWVGTMSSPVRSYLYAHRKDFRNVAFFAVMGGRGGDDTVSEMRLACGTPHAPTLVLTRRDVEQQHHLAQCGGFVRSIQGWLEGDRSTAEPERFAPVDFRAGPVTT